MPGREQISSFGDNDSGYDIGHDAGAAEAGKDDPCKPHKSRIDVKIFGDSAADAAKDAVYR